MIELTNSVGEGAINKPRDVALVQAMLRVINAPKTNKPYVTFNYDGKFTPGGATSKAIQAFQIDHSLNVTYHTRSGIVSGIRLVPNAPASERPDFPGRIEKDGSTFKAMIKLLPATHKDLTAVELPNKQVLVYLPGSPTAAADSEGRVKADRGFIPEFKMKLADLIRKMYEEYQMVLAVVGVDGGYRTFATQRKQKNTKAGPGESPHCFGIGADVGFEAFTWINGLGARVDETNTQWLQLLQKAENAKFEGIWQLRNQLTTLQPTDLKGDFNHLQLYSDSEASLHFSPSFLRPIDRPGLV